MKPIGLALKNIKHNPYTNTDHGELAVVHMCLNCKAISLNRIAGDDNSYSLLSLLETPPEIDHQTLSRLNNLKIKLLTSTDKNEVLVALFGYNYPKNLK